MASITERLRQRRKPKYDLGKDLLERELSLRDQVNAEIKRFYEEVEKVYDEIQELRDDVVTNSLLELLLIYRDYKFPTSIPMLPTYDLEPYELEEFPDDGALEKLGTQTSLLLFQLLSKKRHRKKLKETEEKQKKKRKQRSEAQKAFRQRVSNYGDEVKNFKEKSLAELYKTRDVLVALLARLKKIKSVIDNGYSTTGPEFIANESSEPVSVFTIPMSARFDVTGKNNQIYIKVGAAKENELKAKEDDIPQLKFRVSDPIGGGTISYSFELVGTIPLAFNLANSVDFASGSIGQSASIRVFNDLYRRSGEDEENGDHNHNRTLEIPFSFATDRHIGEEIVTKLYEMSDGAIVIRVEDILMALESVSKSSASAAEKLSEVLEFAKENAELERVWSKGGALANADLLADMSLSQNKGIRKIILMLRTGALKRPWQYVVAVLAVSEGRDDLLERLQSGQLNPTQLFLELDVSKTGQRGTNLLANYNYEDEEEDVPVDRSLELSPTGSQVLGLIDPSGDYHTAQLINIQKACALILDRDFQKGLLNKDSMKERSVVLQEVGSLLTNIKNAKMRMVSEELQLVLDSLELAIIDFQREAEALKPQIAAGLVNMMIERAKRLSIDIPELINTRDADNDDFEYDNVSDDEVLEGEFE